MVRHAIHKIIVSRLSKCIYYMCCFYFGLRCTRKCCIQDEQSFQTTNKRSECKKKIFWRKNANIKREWIPFLFSFFLDSCKCTNAQAQLHTKNRDLLLFLCRIQHNAIVIITLNATRKRNELNCIYIMCMLQPKKRQESIVANYLYVSSTASNNSEMKGREKSVILAFSI